MWKSYLQCLSKKGNIHSLYVQYPSRWSDRFHSVFRFDNETDFSLRLTHTNPPRGKQGRLLDRREMVRGAHMETGEQTYVMKVSICRDSNTRWGAGELITTGVPEGGDQEDPAPARACTHAHTHPHPQTDRQRRESHGGERGKLAGVPRGLKDYDSLLSCWDWSEKTTIKP